MAGTVVTGVHLRDLARTATWQAAGLGRRAVVDRGGVRVEFGERASFLSRAMRLEA